MPTLYKLLLLVDLTTPIICLAPPTCRSDHAHNMVIVAVSFFRIQDSRKLLSSFLATNQTLQELTKQRHVACKRVKVACDSGKLAVKYEIVAWDVVEDV